MRTPGFFDKLEWREDRVLLGDLDFRLEHYRRSDWELGENCFAFFKIKALVDQYRDFWSVRPGFRAQNIFELGIWDGGSTVFWFEYFHPTKYVAIDFANRKDSAYFAQYKRHRGLEERIQTYWNTDQGDKTRLCELAKTEFDGPLDLVIDDASHMYAFTKASFEALFPMLRPGRLYIIEDRAWSHWKEFQAHNHPWAHEIELTRLIRELVEAIGSSTALVNSLHTYQGFAVVERGSLGRERMEDFRLDSYISRRLVQSGIERFIKRLSLRS